MDLIDALVILEYFQNSVNVSDMNKYKIEIIAEAREMVDARARRDLDFFASLKEEQEQKK